jgi:hypothetical protein
MPALPPGAAMCRRSKKTGNAVLCGAEGRDDKRVVGASKTMRTTFSGLGMSSAETT